MATEQQSMPLLSNSNSESLSLLSVLSSLGTLGQVLVVSDLSFKDLEVLFGHCIEL